MLAASPAKRVLPYNSRPFVRALRAVGGMSPSRVLLRGAWPERSRGHTPPTECRWDIIELQWKYCGRYAVSKEQKAAREKEQKVTGTELLILNCC